VVDNQRRRRGRQRDRRGNHGVFRTGSTTTCTARA
jgi:hypothetical protein